MSNLNNSKPIVDLVDLVESSAPHAQSYPGLSQDQIDILHDVDRQARISAQHTSRSHLRDGLPSVMAQIYMEDETKAKTPEDFKKSDARNIENRERWLSTIWPADQTIEETDKEHAHSIYKDIKVFDFEGEYFERNLATVPDLIEMKLVSSTCEKEEREYDDDDDDYENGGDSDYEINYENNLIVISPMVFVKINTSCGEYTDDDYDANVSVRIFISENPQSMLRLLRLEIKDFPPDKKENQTEDNLSRIFGRDYFSPEDIENTPKKMRPS